MHAKNKAEPNPSHSVISQMLWLKKLQPPLSSWPDVLGRREINRCDPPQAMRVRGSGVHAGTGLLESRSWELLQSPQGIGGDRRCHPHLKPSVLVHRLSLEQHSCMNRERFSQAWRADQSNSSLLVSTSGVPTEAAVRTRTRFCSRLSLVAPGFGFMITPAWM